MSVEVTNLQAGANKKGDPTRFSDTFIRADQPFMVGTLWDCIPDPGIGAQTVDFGAAFNITGGNRLRVVNPTGGGSLPVAYMMPRQLSYNNVNSKNQFSKGVIVASGGVVARCGFTVLAVPNAGTSYNLLPLGELAPKQWILRRRANGANTTIINNNPANFYVDGDELRLSVTITAGIPTFSVAVNGVVQVVQADNSGGQFITGMPGLYCEGQSVGAATEFRNFVCGIGEL